jgi:hypothetical protein
MMALFTGMSFSDLLRVALKDKIKELKENNDNNAQSRRQDK